MMAANYRHIGGLENRLGRHYSRFSASGPAAPLAAQSLARRKSRNGGSNRRSWVKGAGEGAIIPIGGLMANAVANALASFGAMPNELPLSPARVWHMSSVK